jgi:hypothetical protein
MSTQSDLRTISTLLGDALSQFAKLFQNEVDLAKAELGEKVQQVSWVSELPDQGQYFAFACFQPTSGRA